MQLYAVGVHGDQARRFKVKAKTDSAADDHCDLQQTFTPKMYILTRAYDKAHS